ncbi:glutamic-type intramembrane protease PrsW [Mangrovibacillus cuniculi]|uniref:Protease PrsW n=1 Tax=Mangrovibacillus cuniculi TaxID=2593652 RepID=A0A7S8CB39_9BACI|nr:glutamic-type intramembrane protease PrsW [Mangrovibacillus cuniculi]QPC46720.1 intramembrane metalloprotease PrsW [Mangrovibacillus cuniculi]
MFVILSAGIAPGLALLSYFYLRDEFESEPLIQVAKTFIFGAIITFPVMFIQFVLTEENIFTTSFLQAFLSIGFIEEFVKWFILYFAMVKHAEFDEPYDGIVYGAAVSLGFATTENILYLVAHGVEIAFVRAILPVSSHALFGVVMGYYLGKAKFSPFSRKMYWLLLSFTAPLLLHGLYDFLLLQKGMIAYYVIPFMFFLWWFGLRKVKLAHQLTIQHYKNQHPISKSNTHLDL